MKANLKKFNPTAPHPRANMLWIFAPPEILHRKLPASNVA